MKIIAIILICLGIVIIIFSGRIVFPHIENIVGIETIVGKSSVIYDDPEDHSKGYIFTNPGAMIKWVGAVALVGFIISFIGLIMLLKNKIKIIYNKIVSPNSDTAVAESE